MELNPDSSIPLYIQLKEYLRTQIEDGVYKSGARLPSERQLAQDLHVSRMTARQALQLLAQDGFVATRVGKGTFVRQTNIDQDLHILTSFTEDMRQRGMDPGSAVLDASLTPAGDDLASQLKIAVGSEVVLLSRVRLADGEPIAWEIAHLNHRLCPEILQNHDFSAESLYHVLRHQYGHNLIWADQLITARMPNEREQDVLALNDRIPVLSLTRVTYIEHDQPIEYVRSVYRCDRYQLRTVLRYSTT